MGFFSMNHEVVDLTSRLNAVYKNYDKFFVSKLIQIIAKRLVNLSLSLSLSFVSSIIKLLKIFLDWSFHISSGSTRRFKNPQKMSGD